MLCCGERIDKMGKSVLNDYCLLSTTCCYSVPLKIGTIIIAIVGLIPSVFYMSLIEIGTDLLAEYDVSKPQAQVVVQIYAVFGTYLFVTHLILLAGAFLYEEVYLLLYLWVGVIFFMFDTTIVTILGIIIMSNSYFWAGTLFIALDTLYWLFLYYYIFPVVNGFRKNLHTVVIMLM